MTEITEEQKARARHKLTIWAHVARNGGQPILRWQEDSEVLNYCKQYELDEDLLDHIAHWVWKGCNR